MFKRFLLALSLVVPVSAFALQPADVVIKTDPAVVVKVTRNKTNTSKQISITVNQQDVVTINPPVVVPPPVVIPPPVVVPPPVVMPPMPMPGNMVDLSTVPVFNNSVNDERVSNIGQFPNPSNEGGFRTVCAPGFTSNNDPIVFPGKPDASHHHTFYGNIGVNSDSTADSIANSGGSTCRGGTVNRTGYWHPSMLDGDKYITPLSAIIYYKNNPRLEQFGHPVYHAFPPGLRMIAGNSKGTSADTTGGFFTCIDAVTQTGAHTLGIGACAPGNDLWMSVEFPSCWDGVNLDSPDHQSHVKYVQQRQQSPFDWFCPATHPVLLPSITTNYRFHINPGQDPTKWHLASDMYTGPVGGYSTHSDWFNGWKPEINAAWVAGCNNAQKDCQAQMLGDGRVLDSFGANN